MRASTWGLLAVAVGLASRSLAWKSFVSALGILAGFGIWFTGWMLIQFPNQPPSMGWPATLGMAWGPLILATGCGVWVRWLLSPSVDMEESQHRRAIRDAANWMRGTK